MKTLILGDLNGSPIWRDIIGNETPDRVIFLGDYVGVNSSIDVLSQFTNLLGILRYCDENPNSIMLAGNHDCGALFKWCPCSGVTPSITQWLQPSRDRILSHLKLAYVEDNIIFSHAGLSKYWLHNIAECKYPEELNDMTISEILKMNQELPTDEYGNGISQSPIWIRPHSLFRSRPLDYIQVVGHTKVPRIYHAKDVYFCDCLPYGYLVYENGKFIKKGYFKKQI